MNTNTHDFWQKAVSDINTYEKREGQLIFSPHWYALLFGTGIILSIILIVLFREKIPVIFLVGSFPVYIIAILYTFETKKCYLENSNDFLDHKILRKHLASFYQSLDKEQKEKFRELILTKRENLTYTDLKNLNNP